MNDEIKDTELSDDDNPEYLFTGINNSILIAAIKGEVDLTKLAKKEMANRGLDLNGEWIGFKAADKVHGINR